MKKVVFLLSGAMAALSMNVMALSNDHTNVSDDIVAQQRANLAKNTQKALAHNHHAILKRPQAQTL